MIKGGIFLLSLAVFASALHMKEQHQSQFDLYPGIVNIKSDIGLYLARCDSCGNSIEGTQNSATVHESNPDAEYAIWVIEPIVDSISLRADNGKYLRICNKCWEGGAYEDAAFANGENQLGPSMWSAFPMAGGKWVFRGSNLKYLARCNNCVPSGAYPNTAFVHIADPNDSAAQWTVEYRFPTGKVNIFADT